MTQFHTEKSSDCSFGPRMRSRHVVVETWKRRHFFESRQRHLRLAVFFELRKFSGVLILF